MGITNPDNPTDNSNCALGVTQFGITLEDTGIEDQTGPDGRADIDRFSDFMRALAPPILAVGVRELPHAVADHRC